VQVISRTQVFHWDYLGCAIRTILHEPLLMLLGVSGALHLWGLIAQFFGHNHRTAAVGTLDFLLNPASREWGSAVGTIETFCLGHRNAPLPLVKRQ
jgi:hypothetical protein